LKISGIGENVIRQNVIELKLKGHWTLWTKCQLDKMPFNRVSLTKCHFDQLPLNKITVDKMSSDITELDKSSEAKWAETKFY
jgi:hypothetical protein